MKFKIEKMMCGGCTSAVKAKLDALENVKTAEVDLESGTATVDGNVDPKEVIETLTEAGYPTVLMDA